MNDTVLKINDSSLMISNRLDKVSLLFDEEGFSVLKEDKLQRIEKHWIDPEIRNIKKEQLNAFLNNGYLSLDQLNSGKYTLKAKVRGLGGGPLCAWVAYWTTKATAYGLMVIVGGKAITSVGVSIGGNLGGPVGEEIGGAIGGVTATLSGLAAGTGPAIEAVAECPPAVIATPAAVCTAAGVAITAGGTKAVASTVAAIEAGSAIVGALLSGPWCP